MNAYSIFLLKIGIQQPADALDPEKNVTAYPLGAQSPLAGFLYVGAQNLSVPAWYGLLNPFLAQPFPPPHNASVSAVVIVSHNARYFALTFGHGKSLLNPDSWVRGFGLKVTLNCVDPGSIRSIDSKVYDDFVVSTRRQTSKSSDLASFELDVARALVQGVTGNAINSALFKRLSGGDALRITTASPFNELPAILAAIQTAFTSTAYQANFPWIDNIREADNTIVSALDDLLIQDLGTPQMSQAYLAPSEIIDWSEVVGFSFTHASKNVNYPELVLAQYLQVLSHKGQVVDLAKLKTHKVRLRIEGLDELKDMASIYNCIVWETTFNGRNYALLDGRWFEVDPDFATSVANYTTGITSNGINFIAAQPNQTEPNYNLACAAHSPNDFACLDSIDFWPTGAATAIEFCDLFTADRQLIHVKRRTSSSTMSHLFGQGAVSAQLFCQDPQFRTEVRDQLIADGKAAHAALIPADRPQLNEFEVVYALIASPIYNMWPPRMPFLSAVNLMHHAKRVQGFGFRVSLQFIAIQ